ncbi:MAG: phosphoribosylamine---glycine ligase [Candidatus Atribacteria bacterium]|nr:phosphoribosylamine---glycine ligase [Candidatus Atribacteria bacterium]
MIVGSGGREHCLAWKVSQSKLVDKIYCAPGNGGMSEIGECVPLESLPDLVSFAQEEKIDLTLVGPEAPLSQGIVDLFEDRSLPIIGPDQRGALLESSKIFAKNFMEKYRIPTASFETFDDYNDAVDYLKKRDTYPLVIKADGLAGGKGVYITYDVDEAIDALGELMVDLKFGNAGERVVIEDFLEGEEATMMVLWDGKSCFLLPSSQDHKRVGEGDIGPNTGGMGAYSPAPVIDEIVRGKVEKNIVHPLLEGIKKEELKYRGVIYLGIMVDKKKEPWVLEFNVRLGDPETQVVLPRINNDWLEVNLAIWEGKLSEVKFSVSDFPVLGVVLASKGYPGNYEIGKKISGLEKFPNRIDDEVLVFHAGTEKGDDGFYTAGGRVLNVCARGKTLREAKDKVYRAITEIHFENVYYRRDIGFRAIGEK